MKYILTIETSTHGKREVEIHEGLTQKQVKNEIEAMKLLGGYNLIDNGRGRGIVTDGKKRGRTWRCVTEWPSGTMVEIVNIRPE